MTVTEKRLDKLYPSLTAKERGILVLRSLKEDTEEDPQVRSTMPTEQVREFNRYIGLMNAASRDLGALVGVVAHMVEELALKAAWLRSLAKWMSRGEGLVPSQPRTGKGTPKPPWEGLIRELVLSLREEIPLRWKELRAVEIVWVEIAREFGGEDPAYPPLRRKVEGCKRKLQNLQRENRTPLFPTSPSGGAGGRDGGAATAAGAADSGIPAAAGNGDEVSGGDKRLDKLFPALTARERAILVLEAWKEDRQEDIRVRLDMPANQVDGFNRLINLMNGANCHLSLYMVVLRTAVATLSAKLGWLLSLHVWGADAWEVAAYLFFNTREPVTESEYRRLVEKARTELVPAKELAEMLVERYDGWRKDDYQTDEASGEPQIADRAWNRVLAEKERDLAQLVSCGSLAGKWRWRRLLIEAGSFYDWLGEQVPVYPDWAMGYEVFPDEKSDEVARLKEEREDIHETLQNAPSNPAVEELQRKALGPEIRRRPGRSRGQNIADALLHSLRQGIKDYWQELRAIDRVLDELLGEFEDQDPLLPKNRTLLEEVRKELTELHHELQTHAEPFELEGPDQDLVELVRQIVFKGGAQSLSL